MRGCGDVGRRSIYRMHIIGFLLLLSGNTLCGPLLSSSCRCVRCGSGSGSCAGGLLVVGGGGYGSVGWSVYVVIGGW